MKDESGSLPYDQPILPGHSPLPSGNGQPLDRIAPGNPFGMPTSTPALAVPAWSSSKDKHLPEQKDAFREVVETIVFVVVLVLLLRTFMAEAFVIPTGSMATTLLGYHRDIECPQCHFRFPLNLSKELDGLEKDQQRITGCTCPNCRLHIDATNSAQFHTGQPPPSQQP